MFYLLVFTLLGSGLALRRVSDIQCPDKVSSCPDGYTCCKSVSGGYACCPAPNAVCCSDMIHCCPQGTTCDVQKSTCDRNGVFSVPWSEKIPATMTDDLRQTNLRANGFVVSVVCPGGVSHCPDGTTCCVMPSGVYGCCPMPKAVCCSDKIHCCPQNTTCDLQQETCIKNSFQMLTTISLIPEVNAEVSGVTCRDGTRCTIDETCCPINSEYNSVVYGCCPYENGVCCQENVCCPYGFACAKNRMCSK